MSPALDGLEAILLAHSWATEDALMDARQFRAPRETLVDAIIETGAVGARELASALAELYRLPLQLELDDVLVDAKFLGRIPASYARRNRILPLGTDGRNLVAALADPSNYHPLDDLSVFFAMPVEPIVASFDVLDQAVSRASDGIMLCGSCGPIITLDREELGPAADALSYERFDMLTGEAGPIIRLVNAIFSEALDEHVSQIQMDPLDREIMVRFRNGSSLGRVMSWPKSLADAIVARVKLMAGMSAERTPLAHDGRIRMRTEGHVIGASLSVIPLPKGDQVVIRLGAKSEHPVNGRTNQPCRLAGDAEVCGQCSARVVVDDAIFCKDCGAPLAAWPFDRSATG
jgi:MshEN domain/Type II/IV secretion system protein